MKVNESKRHQLLQAVRVLNTIVVCVERKYDFLSEDGKELLQEAKVACECLEAAIQDHFPKVPSQE